MHIWYIHSSAGGPGLGAYHRPYHLAQAWKKQGHTSTIYTASFHHLLETQSVPSSSFEIDGTRYVTIPSRRYVGNGLGRILNMWDFSSRLFAAGRRYGRDERKPDAIVVSSPHPFSIFAGRALAKRHGAKLIFEVRDIWPLSLTEILGTSPFHPFVQICAYAERFALTNADLIASVLPRAHQYLADRGYHHKPFVWVPNGIFSQKEKQSGAASDATLAALEQIKRWRNEGCTTIVHAGSIGPPNAVDLLLEALSFGESSIKENKIRVIIVGRGRQLSTLQQFAHAKGLATVHFVGHIPKNDVRRILNICDIAYAGVKPHDRLYRYGVSLNKFADYFEATLPVFLPITPCGDPVSESGGGIARRAETPEAVWRALRELVLLSPQERRALGARGKSYMTHQYDYDVIARRYADAIGKLSKTD